MAPIGSSEEFRISNTTALADMAALEKGTLLQNELRLRELDGIRGIACLLVLVDHLFISMLAPEYSHARGLWRLSGWLIGGVDLFFVLSGFLIGGILLDHKRAQNYFRVFWTRRVGRIMPVYYLLFASFGLVLLIRPFIDAPWLDLFLLKDRMPTWTYALFVQNFAQSIDSIDGGDGGARWVASTWSLAIEEQFYLLLPPLVYILSRGRILALAVTCIVVAVLVRAHLWESSGSWFTAYFLLPGRMDSLMFGVLGALAVRHGPTLDLLRKHRWGLDGAALAVFVVLNTNLIGGGSSSSYYAVRSLDFTFRAALFLYFILRVFLVPETSPYRRALSLPTLVFVGTISYSLYMYHPAINGLLYGIIYKTAPIITDLPHLLTAVTVAVLSIGLAWLSTTYFETPIRRLAGRVKYRDRPASRDGEAAIPRAAAGKLADAGSTGQPAPLGLAVSPGPR